MSVLLWWLPALLAATVAWWRLRPRQRTLREKDMRVLRQALRADR